MKTISELVPFLKKEFEGCEFIVNEDSIVCKSHKWEQKGKIYWEWDADAADDGIIKLYAETKRSINDRTMALQLVNDYNKGLVMKDDCYDYCSAALTENNTLLLKNAFFCYDRLTTEDYVSFYYAAMPTLAAMRVLDWWDELAQKAEKGDLTKDDITYNDTDDDSELFERRDEGYSMDPIEQIIVMGDIIKEREGEEKKKSEEDKKKREEEERKRIEEVKRQEEARKKAAEEEKRAEEQRRKIAEIVNATNEFKRRVQNNPTIMTNLLSKVAAQRNETLTPIENDHSFLLHEYDQGRLVVSYSLATMIPSINACFISRNFENKLRAELMFKTISSANISKDLTVGLLEDSVVILKKSIIIDVIGNEATIIKDIKDGVATLLNAIVNIDDKLQKWPTESEEKAREVAKRERVRQIEAANRQKQMIAQCENKIDELIVEISQCEVDVAKAKEDVVSHPDDTFYKRRWAEKKTKLAEKKAELTRARLKLKELKKA